MRYDKRELKRAKSSTGLAYVGMLPMSVTASFQNTFARRRAGLVRFSSCNVATTKSNNNNKPA